jgi:hypothetical protein
LLHCDEVIGKDFENDIDFSTEIADLWADPILFIRGGSGGDLLFHGNGRGAIETDRILEDTPERNNSGDLQRGGTDYRIDQQQVTDLVRIHD